MDYGQSASRFIEAKVHKPKAVDLGPRILLDAERCILCTRCIRFTKDIAGDDALGIVNRGSFNTIATFPGMPFDNNYTLNTADICPVGALTSKDFRFKMRVQVSQGNQERLHKLCDRLQRHDWFARRKSLSLYAARKRCRQRPVDVRRRTFELQVDRTRRSFERRAGARTKNDVDSSTQPNFPTSSRKLRRVPWRLWLRRGRRMKSFG